MRDTGLGRGKQVGIVLISYALLCLPFTYPILFKLDQMVLGWPGDNLEHVWKMWWFKHTLVDERLSTFSSADSLEILGGWGLKYVLVNKYAYRERWTEVLRRITVLPLLLVAELDDIYVYTRAQPGD